MTLSTDEELVALRQIGGIVARCLAEMGSAVRAGVTTKELDDLGARFLAKEGAYSAPMVSYEFPGTTCISVNEEVAHGIPGDRVLADGDFVHLDVSAEKDGFFSDVGASFVVGEPTPLQRRLMGATKRALNAAISKARAGAPLRHVGRAIETEARRHGFGVVRNLGSHGIGRKLHEDPRYVPGYEDPNESRLLHDGLVMTLEPFLTTGKQEVETAVDGWTLLNDPGTLTAQFEHTLVIRRGRPLILTAI